MSHTGLEMRGRCERSDAPLKPEGQIFICSYECTFCPTCAAAMDRTCANCGGRAGSASPSTLARRRMLMSLPAE